LKQSNAILLALAALIVGFVGGLLFAAYKGPPPGLEEARRPASSFDLKPESQPDADLEAKMAELKAQIEANAGKPGPYIQAGNLLFDHERFDEAVRYYEKALELEPENADLLTDAGICYRQLKQPDKAVSYFRRARKADPGHPNSALNLGIVLLHDLGDKKAALEAWREYLALNPQGPRADMIRRVVAQIESGG